MLLDLWYSALKAKLGIAIETDNRAILRQHLYRARAEANKPELESIVMIIPEKEDEIWLVQRHADSPRAHYEGDIEPL